MIKEKLSMIPKLWSQFWFEPVSLLNLAVFRILIGAILVSLYIPRAIDWKLFFSDESFLQKSQAFEVMPNFHRPIFSWVFWPDSMGGVAHWTLVALLVLLTFGIGGRFIAIAAWILQMGFTQRNISIAFGADIIGGIFLLYLAMTQSQERLSIWNWLVKKKGMLNEQSDILTRVFYRMIQVQLCVIYSYTGFEKLKGVTWWDGTALWSVFANSQMVIMDLTWIVHVPFVIGIITFGTILFEVYFPALVWNKKTRPAVLLGGVAFHLGIGFLMALWAFAGIMLAPYLLFLEESQIANVLKKLKIKSV